MQDLLPTYPYHQLLISMSGVIFLEIRTSWQDIDPSCSIITGLSKQQYALIIAGKGAKRDRGKGKSLCAKSSHSSAEDSGIAAVHSTEASKRAFKYPYVACEVFCCNSDSIMKSLLGEEELMAQLFSALDLPKPLNCVLAGMSKRKHFT